LPCWAIRSLFFLLRGAIDKFSYLPQGIAVVLVFIGLKMLAELFHVYLPVYASLLVIVVCLVAAILYSIRVARKKARCALNTSKKSSYCTHQFLTSV